MVNEPLYSNKDVELEYNVTTLIQAVSPGECFSNCNSVIVNKICLVHFPRVSARFPLKTNQRSQDKKANSFIVFFGVLSVNRENLLLLIKGVILPKLW